jgi:hypothetical protein
MTGEWTEAADVIDEVREIRWRLFAELAHDPEKIAAYHMELNGLTRGCTVQEEWTEADDVIEEIWEIRRQIWARFDNDPEKVIAYYQELDRQHASEMIVPPEPRKEGKSAA